MEIKNAWDLNANTAKKTYGSYVDYEERFYICPFCEDLVYEEDWTDEQLCDFLCPICEDIDLEN